MDYSVLEDNNELYENYKKDLVSTIAYLIGVRDSIVRQEAQFEQEIIEKLEEDENAKKIRALSILRTELLRNYKEISNRRNNFEPMESLTDLLSINHIKFLREKGIETVHANVNVILEIAYINQYILEIIDSIRSLIPTWIKWDYIKSIFLMPGCYAGHNGAFLQNKNNKSKITTQINLVRVQIGSNVPFYPYGTYLNWPREKIKSYYGNILFNDEKFLKILYASFDDTFRANEYVIDAKREDKQSIYDFIVNSNNIAIFVDCENVDPYRFASVFKNLEEENLQKIKKVILYDDVNTSDAWDYINESINLPIEHKLIERILNKKSLVDISMATGACKEYYQENTESLILASSDSDFWGLIQSLPYARFYILNESDKTSEVILDKLDEEMIDYCFMDSFAQAEVQDFKNKVLVRKLREKIDEFNDTGVFPTMDAMELVDMIFLECHIQGAYFQLKMEKEEFYKKYLKKGFKIVVSEKDGAKIFQMELNISK